MAHNIKEAKPALKMKKKKKKKKAVQFSWVNKLNY